MTLIEPYDTATVDIGETRLPAQMVKWARKYGIQSTIHGIYSAVDGALIAQGAGGLPVFVGTMQYSTAELIRLISEGEVNPPEPEDIYIVNDPYLGGTHLMDVRFAYPYFREDKLWCWLSNTGHWPDTGGSVPAVSSNRS